MDRRSFLRRSAVQAGALITASSALGGLTAVSRNHGKELVVDRPGAILALARGARVLDLPLIGHAASTSRIRSWPISSARRCSHSSCSGV